MEFTIFWIVSIIISLLVLRSWIKVTVDWGCIGGIDLMGYIFFSVVSLVPFLNLLLALILGIHTFVSTIDIEKFVRRFFFIKDKK